jgi:hypothetical protein
MIVYSDDSGPVTWPTSDLHDPHSKKYYYINYRPPVRENEKEYVKGVDVVILDTPNGCIYECISGGISNHLNAHQTNTFTTVEGKTTDDGDVKWKCKPDTSRLRDGDTITTSTWSSTEPSVTLSGEVVLSNIQTGVRVDAVSSSIKKFTLTNHITIQRLSGRVEEFDKSLIISVKEL